MESGSSSCKRSRARRRLQEAVTKKVLEKAGGILPGTALMKSFVQPIYIDTRVVVSVRGCVHAKGNSPP